MPSGGYRAPPGGMQPNGHGVFPEWTPEEDEVIRTLKRTALIKERLPHRSKNAILFRRWRLGIHVYGKRKKRK